MGHLIFLFLHAIAFLFISWWLLFLTIPAHLIYGATRSGADLPRGEDTPTPHTHVRCPDCRELVRKDAAKCKHCGTKLVPQA